MKLKLSMFNVVEEIGGQPVLFNCRTHAVLRGRLCTQLLERGADGLLQMQQRELHHQGIVVSAEAPEAEVLQAYFMRRKFENNFLQLSVVPTYRCNCACPDCTQLTYDKGDVIDEATIRGVAQLTGHAIQIRRPMRVVFWLAGGEPFTCLDASTALTQQVQEVCEREGVGFEGSVSTNGTLLNVAPARPLVDRLERFYVSLAASPKAQQEQRPFANGKNSYDAVLRGLAMIGELNKQVVVRFNLDAGQEVIPDLRETILDVHRALGKVAYPKFTFEFHMLLHRPTCAEEPHLAPAKGTDARDRLLPALRELAQDLPWPAEHFILPATISPLAKATPLTDDYQLRLCDFHKGVGYYITPNGDYWPCSIFAEQKEHWFGRVQDSPYIYHNNDKYLRFINHDAFDDPRCCSCSYLPLCLRGCPLLPLERNADRRQWSYEGCEEKAHRMVMAHLQQWLEQREDHGDAPAADSASVESAGDPG